MREEAPEPGGPTALMCSIMEIALEYVALLSGDPLLAPRPLHEFCRDRQ